MTISLRAQARVVMSVAWGILLLGTIVALSVAEASVLLVDGAVRVPLPGTTVFAEPDLAGAVEHERTIPFEIRGADGSTLFRGALQNRAVRSGTQRVHFYYRIRDTVPGLPGRIVRVDTIGFPGMVHADYRIDGAGTVAPVAAGREGGLIKFFFVFPGMPTVTLPSPPAGTDPRRVDISTAAPSPPGLHAGTESRLFFVKGVYYGFRPGGSTTLVLSTGERVTLPTVRPLP